METVALSSLSQLRRFLETVPVCGILLEVTTLVLSDALTKEETHDLFDLYPTAKFRMTGGKVLMPGETPQTFVARCREFEPRMIRKEDRETKFIAVYLSASETFEDAEKTITINVSEHGMFVFSSRTWRIGDRVWVKTHDEAGVISAVIRSVKPWGDSKGIPGLGLETDERWMGEGMSGLS
jgi:hypothetical protein